MVRAQVLSRRTKNNPVLLGEPGKYISARQQAKPGCPSHLFVPAKKKKALFCLLLIKHWVAHPAPISSNYCYLVPS